MFVRLSPCLGHNLFEGIVAYDLNLYIDSLLNQEECFTFTELNHCVKQLEYSGNDAANQLAEIYSGNEKLCGHAVQNRCLLPVVVGHRIKNTESAVWQLVLLLRHVVDLVCAPAILVDQVCYLEVLIEECVHFSHVTFPSEPLKPKHRYLCHYPEQMTQFGPTHSNLRTVRFESKHAYFEQCARKVQKLAEQHQLLQAY